MPNIKPISDLRNYSDVLHDMAVGAPVFLTKSNLKSNHKESPDFTEPCIGRRLYCLRLLIQKVIISLL